MSVTRQLKTRQIVSFEITSRVVGLGDDEGSAGPPPSLFLFLLETGGSYWQLENSTDRWVLEG